MRVHHCSRKELLSVKDIPCCFDEAVGDVWRECARRVRKCSVAGVRVQYAAECLIVDE